MSSSIKVIKLSNNDDVIGHCQLYVESPETEISDENFGEEYEEPQILDIIIMQQPMKIIMTKTKKEDTIVLERWMPYSADGMYIIPKSQILAIVEPSENLVDFYLENTEEIMNSDIVTNAGVEETAELAMLTLSADPQKPQ